MRRVAIPLLLALAGCGGGAGARLDAGTDGSSGDGGAADGGLPSISAAQWPEADALFHQDPRWLGADAAFSVPLGGDRVLWLFGDTFVATSAANLRSQSKMPRNTIAIQTGLDPTTASITFHWRGTMAAPTSFFPEEGNRWFWPGHGIRVGGTLIVFLAREQATPGVGLGFAGDGWRAVVIDNPDAAPPDWHLRNVDPTSAPAGFNLAQGLLRRGDDIFGLAVREPGDHMGSLVRWHAADLEAGRIDAAEWWNGTTYVPAAMLGGDPAKVLSDAGPESSLHFDTRLGRFVHVRSDGFGATTIAVAFADRLEGPWSSWRSAFRPPEDDRPQAFVYAGKGHPELTGADLVVTYAANTFAAFSVLVGDSTLYYPRFVKLSFGP